MRRFIQSFWAVTSQEEGAPTALPALVLRLASSSFWLVLAGVASQGAMLVSNVLVANHLGVSDFGAFSLMQTTFSTLAICTQLGFGVVLARYVSLHRSNEGQISEIASFAYSVVLALSLAVGFIVFALAGPIARDLFHSVGLDTLLPFGLAMVPLAAIAYVQQGLLNGLGRFSVQAKLALALVPAVVALPLFGTLLAGPFGALAGLATVFAVRAIGNQWLLRQVSFQFVFRRANVQAFSKTVTHQALPATLGGLSMAIAIWAGNAILLRYNANRIEYGLYAAAFTIRTLIMFIPSQVMNAMMPLLTHVGETQGRNIQRRLLIVNVLGSGIIASALCGLGLLFTENFMRLFGSGFVAGASILNILLISSCIEVIYTIAYQDLQSAGRFWTSTLGVNVPRDVTFIIVAMILVPNGLGMGLAKAWLIAQIVGMGLTFFYVSRRHAAGLEIAGT